MKKLTLTIIILTLAGFCGTGRAMGEIPEVSAVTACVIDGDNGDLIYDKLSQQRMPMASTTKIMTALVMLENCSADEIVTVSAAAAATEGSSAYINAGDKLYVRDLLYGLMLNSGNDAAVAAAEHVAGNEAAFAAMMNEKATKLGLKNTCFENASGLDGESHYTTAHDLARIAAEALKNSDFREIVACREKTITLAEGGSQLTFINHNKLLGRYEGAMGVKTGFTKKCGRCLVSAAQRNGKTIIAVTLNAGDDWNDHVKLLDFGFSCMNNISVVNSGDVLARREIDGKEYEFAAAENISMEVAGEKRNFEIVTHMAEKFTLPIQKGEKTGYAEVLYKGKTVAEFDLLSVEKIEKKEPEKISFIASVINAVKSIFGVFV